MPLTWRHEWPIVDDTVQMDELRAEAWVEVCMALADRGLRPAGNPVIEVEGDDDLRVVATVAAAPSRIPLRVVVGREDCAKCQELSFLRRIGETLDGAARLLGYSRDAVMKHMQRHWEGVTW